MPWRSMKFFAHAKFSALRVHAAQNYNVRVGLFRNLRRVIDERQIWDEPTFAAARMYW